MTENTPRTVLEELFRMQRFAVLATAQAGDPYASLVAFAVTPDLKGVLFVTSQLTRKYGNLRSDPRVALLIDSRANRVTDFQAAVAVTALGRASELAGAEHQAFLGVYLERHPSMREFAHAPTTSLFRVSVERYVLVDHFQHVVNMDVGQGPSC
jgi:nitroimidazol reductase NimA-like FMN-containing flavoprotein (pyridoxamine 5'-phosphate oxidase superfamily)